VRQGDSRRLCGRRGYLSERPMRSSARCRQHKRILSRCGCCPAQFVGPTRERVVQRLPVPPGPGLGQRFGEIGKLLTVHLLMRVSFLGIGIVVGLCAVVLPLFDPQPAKPASPTELVYWQVATRASRRRNCSPAVYLQLTEGREVVVVLFTPAPAGDRVSTPCCPRHAAPAPSPHQRRMLLQQFAGPRATRTAPCSGPPPRLQHALQHLLILHAAIQISRNL